MSEYKCPAACPSMSKVARPPMQLGLRGYSWPNMHAVLDFKANFKLEKIGRQG